MAQNVALIFIVSELTHALTFHTEMFFNKSATAVTTVIIAIFIIINVITKTIPYPIRGTICYCNLDKNLRDAISKTGQIIA